MLSSSPYTETICGRLVAAGRTDVHPNMVEAYIRLAHPTLDHLSPADFDLEVEIGLMCVDEVGLDAAREAAHSFGLEA